MTHRFVLSIDDKEGKCERYKNEVMNLLSRLGFPSKFTANIEECGNESKGEKPVEERDEGRTFNNTRRMKEIPLIPYSESALKRSNDRRSPMREFVSEAKNARERQDRANPRPITDVNMDYSDKNKKRAVLTRANDNRNSDNKNADNRKRPGDSGPGLWNNKKRKDDPTSGVNAIPIVAPVRIPTTSTQPQPKSKARRNVDRFEESQDDGGLDDRDILNDPPKFRKDERQRDRSCVRNDDGDDPRNYYGDAEKPESRGIEVSEECANETFLGQVGKYNKNHGWFAVHSPALVQWKFNHAVLLAAPDEYTKGNKLNFGITAKEGYKWPVVDWCQRE